MALNFPNSPTNGQIYLDVSTGNRWAWDAANTCWKSTSAFTQAITIAASAPGSPVVGQLWWNQDYGRLFVYYNDGDSYQWVDASPADYNGTAAYGVANSSFTSVNSNWTVTNAVYGIANTALQNTTTTYSGSLTIVGNLSFTTANNNFTVPTGSTAGRPSASANGMIRYNTTLNTFEGYKAGTWGAIGGGATGGGSDDAFYENTTTITSDYTITTNKNAMTAGPVTLNTGVTITVPAGSTWTVV